LGKKTVVPSAGPGPGNEGAGNEGVGNGEDAPPPGHDTNLNDGTGTGPGQPGRKQINDRDDDSLGRFFDSFKRDDKYNHQSGKSALPVLERRWFDQKDYQLSALEQVQQSQQIKRDVEQHWAELTQALNRLDAERQSLPMWRQVNQGADLSGLVGSMQGGGHGMRGAIDAVSLACGTGTKLKGFSGIKEGMGKLSW
jgi:hypothetical protein